MSDHKFIDSRSIVTSSDEVIQMFIDLCWDTCRNMVQRTLHKDGDNYITMISSELMCGEDAYALLELAREQGFSVELTNGVHMWNKYSVVLVEY